MDKSRKPHFINNMTKKQKQTLLRIIISIITFIIVVLIPSEGVLRLILFLIPYAIIGWDVIWRAIRNIAHGEIFDENFLMAIATIGAFVLGEYPEGVFVILFYQIGELFQSYAVGRSRQSITELMDIRPDYANIERNGELVKVDPEDISIGDIIVVKPGERIPLDGVIIEGTATIDTAALTGESVPRTVGVEDAVISGCINQTGVLKIRVEKTFGESTVAKILQLVEESSSKKAKAENFITRFAKYYTPIVVIGAVLLAIIPSLITGEWNVWIERALIFLVVSCPCALVISVPLSFFGGIGGASRIGVLIKGGNYLEALSEADTIVFDKTGTLTKGTFTVTEISPVDVSKDELLRIAATAESFSDHPISLSLKAAYKAEINSSSVTDYNSISGKGISAKLDGKPVYIGNDKLMADVGIPGVENNPMGTNVHTVLDGKYIGRIVISDELKPDAKECIASLKSSGIKQTIMLTGDTTAVANNVAQKLGIDKVYAELLPDGKVAIVEKLLGDESATGKLAFVGDGVNDAPVLTRSDIGIAMGALGSDAAIEAADVVLMDDQPSKISQAIKIAKKTLRIVKQNIVFALVVKVLVLILGALGLTNMWTAIFADVGVMVLAVLNASRTLSGKTE